MTKPLQRILKHHPIMRRHARDLADRAEMIDVARAVIRRELRDLGATRIPADDRAEMPPAKPNPSTIDYADPTGDTHHRIARRWQQLAADLEALQDLEAEWLDTSGHMLAIAQRYARPGINTEPHTEPQCERCDRAVEATDRARRGFRGARRVGDEWVRADNDRPVLCAGCRSRDRRVA
ncbi:MAG: hypothetical protein ACK5O2_12135 [Microthrixaceae bacterium]